MSVRWQKGTARATGSESLRVHHSQSGQRSLVCFLSDAEGISDVNVHWIAEDGNRGRGFPCFEEDCRLCPMARDRRWYAPVLLYLRPLPGAASEWTPPVPPFQFDPLHWRRVVLEITAGWRSLVQQAAADLVVHLYRPAGGKQTRTRYAALGKMEGVPQGLMFDVQKVMEHVWGIDEFYKGGQ